ncbi:MAG TPA: SPASM domain-containing protein [Allosphingosinicella sp.]|jgi:MoaA/NifB/PqqE/SkfB family radical SAM enzyme
MNVANEQALPRFTGVEPLAGFSRPTRIDPAPSFTPFFFHVADESLVPEESDPLYEASGRCTVTRLADSRYLQCELRFAHSAGSLEVWHDGRLADRAELVDGWQHSAVDLAGLPIPAELVLVFRTSGGEEVDGTLIRTLFLSDEWGRGQRRRLKCHLPWSMAVVVDGFTVYPCCCPGWLKGGQIKGNTRDESLAEIWNGTGYREMRAQFLAGDYETACREDICPILTGESRMGEPPAAAIRAINEGRTELDFGPAGLQHDIDKGCNLECVMCRDFKILPDAGNIDQAIADMHCAIEMGGLESVSFSGAGEVFVMAKVIRLLESDLFSSRGIAVNITSNLTHFNERLWQRIRHNKFGVFAVSIDGCTTEVYEKIRIGARWETVRRNLVFLASLRRSGQIQHLTWNYTVQRGNVSDVGEAVRQARALDFDLLRFIAQFRSQERSDGNPFEEGDMEALDRVQAQLEAEDAFDDPRVLTSELGLRDGRHRGVEHRLEMAEHLLDRAYIMGDRLGLVHEEEWLKCVRLVSRVRDDVEAGIAVPGFSPRNLVFLRRFTRTALRLGSNRYRLKVNLRRRDGRALIRDWRVARWSAALARRAPPEAQAPIAAE